MWCQPWSRHAGAQAGHFLCCLTTGAGRVMAVSDSGCSEHWFSECAEHTVGHGVRVLAGDVGCAMPRLGPRYCLPASLSSLATTPQGPPPSSLFSGKDGDLVITYLKKGKAHPGLLLYTCKRSVALSPCHLLSEADCALPCSCPRPVPVSAFLPLSLPVAFSPFRHCGRLRSHR